MVRISRAFLAALSFVLALAAPGTSQAQSDIGRVIDAPSALKALRARQAELFQQLLDEPDNLDVMFDYAVVSIRVEDYEAAISTLERMLIYRQDLPRVRLELAVAYFNLGSYAVADLYFDQVLDDENTPETVRRRIAPYKTAIAERTRSNVVTGLLTVGLTYATNATLGPDNDQVQAFGGIATLTSGREEDDFGLRVVAQVTHLVDLEQADQDVWKTDATAVSVRYFGTSSGDLEFFRLRTGPRLSLNREQFGPKIRPYVEAQYLVSDNRGLFGSYGAGAEYSDTLSSILSVFGDGGVRYRNFFRSAFTDEDLFNIYGAGGVAYIPVRDLVLRGALIAEADLADEDFNSNIELGLRVSGEFQYDPDIEWVDRKWIATAYGEARYRGFFEPEAAIDPDTRRRDIDLRAGFSHIFALRDGFGIQLDVDALLRESNLLNFDLSNISTTVSAQYRF